MKINVLVSKKKKKKECHVWDIIDKRARAHTHMYSHAIYFCVSFKSLSYNLFLNFYRLYI